MGYLAEHQELSTQVAVGLQQDTIRLAHNWLSRLSADQTAFRCSDYYRFLDTQLPESLAHPLKLFGEAFGHYTLSTQTYAEYGSVERLLPLIEISEKLGIDFGPPSCLPQRDRFELQFSFRQVQQLPLGDILRLRTLPSFVALRWHLSRYRAGHAIAIMTVQELLSHCQDELLAYLSSSSPLRDSYLEARRIEQNRPILEAAYDAAQAVAPIALTILYGSSVPIPVMAFFAATFFVAKRKYLQPITRSMCAISNTKTDHAVDAVKGTTRGLI